MSRIEILHEEAVDIAEEAFLQRRKGNSEKAIRLFSQALELENQAASTFPPEKASEPTRSVLYRSAASLAFHAKKYQLAQQLVAQGLSGYPPSEIETELKDLYEQANFACVSDVVTMPPELSWHHGLKNTIPSETQQTKL